MHAETADLPLRVQLDRVYRRARGLRARRAAARTGVGAAVLTAAALVAVPAAGLLPGGGRSQFAAPPTCPASTPTSTVATLGQPVDTGVNIPRYEVVIELLGPPDDPMFTVAFQDQMTGVLVPWDMTELPRGVHGDLTAKGESWYFESSQLVVDADHVLDMGVYSGAAKHITVASAGQPTDAHTAENTATGWTLFWVLRAAKPLPEGANQGPRPYEGPERLTITAYGADGQVEHAVTGGFHTGNRTQNPRDDSGTSRASASPGCR
jgi:hypothetical protein